MSREAWINELKLPKNRLFQPFQTCPEGVKLRWRLVETPVQRSVEEYIPQYPNPEWLSFTTTKLESLLLDSRQTENVNLQL